MPGQVTVTTNEQRLDRVLSALERELLGASDEEIREAAGAKGLKARPCAGRSRRGETLNRAA